jgi:hypothetical protein
VIKSKRISLLSYTVKSVAVVGFSPLNETHIVMYVE